MDPAIYIEDTRIEVKREPSITPEMVSALEKELKLKADHESQKESPKVCIKDRRT